MWYITAHHDVNAKYYDILLSCPCDKKYPFYLPLREELAPFGHMEYIITLSFAFFENVPFRKKEKGVLPRDNRST